MPLALLLALPGAGAAQDQAQAQAQAQAQTSSTTCAGYYGPEGWDSYIRENAILAKAVELEDEAAIRHLLALPAHREKTRWSQWIGRIRNPGPKPTENRDGRASLIGWIEDTLREIEREIEAGPPREGWYIASTDSHTKPDLEQAVKECQDTHHRKKAQWLRKRKSELRIRPSPEKIQDVLKTTDHPGIRSLLIHRLPPDPASRAQP